MKNGIITNAVDWRNRKLQGYVKFQGLPLSIENERGSYRQGTDEHGNVWKTFMALKYGYIRATLGVDGDCVDVYVGNNSFSNRVFIIHQNDPFTGKYDEDKVILGVGSPEEAKTRYLGQYDRPDYFGSMEEVDMATFKKMLKVGKGIKLKKISSKKSFSNTRTSHAKSAGNLTDVDTLIKKSKSDISVELENSGKLEVDFLTFESSGNNTTRHVESSSNLLKSHSGLSHANSDIEIPFKGTRVFSPMDALRHKLKIGNDIVKSIPIFMMDNFRSEQSPSEMSFHNDPMLKALRSASKSDESILSLASKSTDVTSSISSSHDILLETQYTSSSKNSQGDMVKAKYLRRWRGKDGKWRYEYTRQKKIRKPSKVKADASVFKYIVSDKFNAAEWAAKRDSPSVSMETVLRDAGNSGILKKIQATEEKLHKINPTTDLYRLFGEGAGAIYDQIRTKKHDQIIRTILSQENVAKARPTEGEKPSFIMLGGRGGSGKSWFNGHVYDPDKCIVLDSDKIKGMLEEYKGWNAFEVHEESSDILDKITIIAQHWGLNIVVDATLKSTRNAVVKAEEFQRLGYSLECHYIHLPREKAAIRAVSRFMDKTSRYVPVDVILANTTNEQTFEELKGYTDSWSFYDNSGDPPPKLISNSGSGKFATLSKGLHTAVVDNLYRKNFDYYDFRPSCDPEDYAPDVKEFISMGDLQKAEYTRRWKGKDGKWNYEYGTSVKNKKESNISSIKQYESEYIKYYTKFIGDSGTAITPEIKKKLQATAKLRGGLLKKLMDSVGSSIAFEGTGIASGLDTFYKLTHVNMKDMTVEIQRGNKLFTRTFDNLLAGKEKFEIKKSLQKSKYTNKYWKNGRWHYTYDKNGSRRPKQMPSHAVHKNLGGTTGGAFLISMPNGERKVMKQSTSPKHITEEYTANRVYKILGVPVPNVSLYSTEKGVAQIADFVEGTPMGDLEPEERYDAIESLKRGFVADALLGNWDVMGMVEDNILWDGSKAWRIDNGGAMRYRAQGAAKGEAFAGTVGEVDSMRNPDRGAGKVFHGVTEAEIMSQINNVKAHKQAILQAVADPKLRATMEARINSLTALGKSMNWLPDLTLLKSNSGIWHLYEHGMLTQFYWFHDLEKAIKTKSYYSPEEVKARGMRWVTIRGARVLLQGTADGGYVVVGGAGGKLNHLKIDKILSKEEYTKKRGKVEAKRTEDLRKLSKEEMAEQVARRREEVKAKKVVRAAYTEKVTEVLGITQEEIRSEISAKQMDDLANKARIMIEGRASTKTMSQKAIDKEIEKQTEKELNKAVHKKIKDTERQALETLMKDYMPDDPNAKPELKKLLDHDKAIEILAARKEFRKQIKAIGKDAADIPTDLKVGDVFAGATDADAKAIEQEVRDQIETQKNIRLYDTMNAQSLSIQKHVDEGAISALNGLIGDLYGSGATFSSDTITQLGLEAVVRSVAIKIQKDGRGGAVKKALEEYSASEREKVVTTALKESEKRFKNADQLRSLARDTDDAEAILSMASANGHALKQLTAGQRALGTAVGSLRAVAHLTAALDDPPADVVQIDIGKDLTRARKKAQKAGLTKGSYSIKTLKEGRAKRLVLELKKENVDNFFQHNEEMRKSENVIDKIKRHEMNDGYKPEGIQDSIAFDDAQEAGLRFFKEQNNVILDFEAGLGKTGMAYGAMMEAIQNKGAKKILVVTPAKTRGDFKSQSKTFLTKDMQKMVLSSTENTSRVDRHARHNAESGIHIVSQDSLRNDAATIKAAGYDMIVVDEIHEMTAGTGQAGRYKALQTLSDIPMKIVMSGTNIKNKKSELYRKINFVNPEHTLGSMAEFDKRYKGLNQGTGMFANAANEAFRKEMSPYMYTQKNALDIENKVTTERVAMTPSQRKAYAASERQYREDRTNKVPGASAKRDSRNYKIITDGHDINNGKLNKLVDIMNTKHDGEKAVIHVSRPGVPVLEAMRTASTRLVKEYGENAVGMIHGESSPGAVTELKRRFNNPDDPLRFIVGTKSLESGHNLQHGGSVTFHLDIPDSYSAFEQRNARIFRKKQDQDTNTYVLSGSNPYDMRGEDIMETKRKEQGILGNPREIESMDDSGFLGLLNKYEAEVQGATA